MRKLTLYINGKEVELNDHNLILFNYTLEDLEKPADVKNSYTQSIEIDGTPKNDAIFGGAYRFDNVASAVFNPLIRIPFQIFSDTSELLEAGYMKLDSVKRGVKSHSYMVTLYGELGNILYHLAYKDDGTKKNLADLNYISDYPNDLDFQIDAGKVKAFWERLKAIPDIPSSVADCINFAPVYGGVPKGETFDAKRGIAPLGVLPVPSTQEGVYAGSNTKTIVTFPKECSQDDVADLRSYLQRPVLSVKALFYALVRECRKYGYTFNFDSCETLPIGWWQSLWITLPSMQGITKKKSERIPITMTWDSRFHSVNPITNGSIFTTLPSVADIKGKATLRIRFSASDLGEQLQFVSRNIYAMNFIQMVARNKDGDILGGSPVYCIGYIPNRKEPSVLVSELGYLPEFPTSEIIAFPNNQYGVEPSTSYPSQYELDGTFDVQFTGKMSGADKIYINCTGYHYYTSQGRAVQQGSTGLVALFDQGGVDYMNRYATIDVISDEFTYEKGGTMSFSKIRKADLLATKGTPLDYLLSYAKTFGMVLDCNSESKTISIIRRSEWYRNKVEDISGRVDLSSVHLEPSAIKSKFYAFKSKDSGSGFEKEYNRTFGKVYGMQTADTGFSFDASEKDVLNKSIFKNGVTCLENSANFARYTLPNSIKYLPSPLMAGGGTYRLWKGDGESKEFPVSIPRMDITWYNPTYTGYDIAGAYKLQLNDGGKPVDGEDILVAFCGFLTHPYAKLSDDTQEMLDLNNGKPCWDLNTPSAPLEMPVFARSFKTADMGGVSLDFGVPAELFAPVDTYPADSTIYSGCWKKYMEDRYSVNTKVVRAKVDFTGIKVDRELMRKFYWFGNSIWALNKIINHSLTTDDLTECEFIKVQDLNNYLK